MYVQCNHLLFLQPQNVQNTLFIDLVFECKDSMILNTIII